ncbi:MAG: hypoxanthine phosphoribosyltransferase, partial [Clostridia bacterium]|nr:hypoxanthine phosphoribosyltransferase [Clostridia bacterium]
MKRPGDDIEKILFDEETLDKRITEMAAEIDKYYAESDRTLVLMCTLNGAVVFLTDIMRKLTVDCEIDFMKVSSYGRGTVSGGKVKILLDCARPDLSNT